ncbi:histidine phosphatase family protein [Aeromonas veronii]|uniref:histidine phosphatase family protein n=1 Tax=Aeromonas veronii TaxID=654 RepID=UPI003D2102E9
MDFVYIRHEKTEFSIKNLYAGRKNIPIILLDYKSTTSLVERVRIFKSPTKIYHSPLLRAEQTKNILVENLHLQNIESNVCDLLIERDFGKYEGTFKSEQSRHEIELCRSTEPFDKVKERARLFLQLTDNDSYFWVIGHSSFYKALRCITKQTNLPDKIGCGEAIQFNL